MPERMSEPKGLTHRLHDGQSTAEDLAYLEYRLGLTTDVTEAKLLRGLLARLAVRMPIDRL
jgi:hypothetical protein